LATLVTLCDAQAGEPLVQLAKCGQGHEKTLAHELVEVLPPGTLEGAIVGGDALYADPSLVRQLVQEQGTITLVQLKDKTRARTGHTAANLALLRGLVLIWWRRRHSDLCAPAFVLRNQRRLPAAIRELSQPLTR